MTATAKAKDEIRLVNARRMQVWELQSGQWVLRGRVWLRVAARPVYISGGSWMVVPWLGPWSAAVISPRDFVDVCDGVPE